MEIIGSNKEQSKKEITYSVYNHNERDEQIIVNKNVTFAPDALNSN